MLRVPSTRAPLTPVRSADRLDRLFLSAHFDDAIGSCGGTMWRLRRAGHAVRLLTIFGGEPVAPLSKLALRYHAAAGGLDGVAARRAEDAAARRSLGVAGEHLDHPDAIYRRDDSGAHLYPKPASITAPVATADSGLAERIANDVGARLASPATVVYCPMAVGGHVDHVLTRDAGLRLTSQGVEVVFYADFFYTAFAGRGEPADLRGDLVRLTPTEFHRKLKAFAEYRSQIRSLFGHPLRFAAHFCRHGWTETFLSAGAFCARSALRVSPADAQR